VTAKVAWAIVLLSVPLPSVAVDVQIEHSSTVDMVPLALSKPAALLPQRRGRRRC
jgi:hypothetical protein